MGVWIIAGVVLILALLVRWRHALQMKQIASSESRPQAARA